MEEDFARLRQAVRLLGSEVAIEGWSARRHRGVTKVQALVLVTDWRLIIVEAPETFAAFPILKIDLLERRSPICIRLTSWYESAELCFDSQGASAAVVNLLRQDPKWGADEVDLRINRDAAHSRRTC